MINANPDDMADLEEACTHIIEFLQKHYADRPAIINTCLIHLLAVGIPDEKCLKIAVFELQRLSREYQKEFNSKGKNE